MEKKRWKRIKKKQEKIDMYTITLAMNEERKMKISLSHIIILIHSYNWQEICFTVVKKNQIEYTFECVGATSKDDRKSLIEIRASDLFENRCKQSKRNMSIRRFASTTKTDSTGKTKIPMRHNMMITMISKLLLHLNTLHWNK